ncbi:MAG: signal recognition particle-docking protein FtsY [Candidatus Thermoplasmatota archaeon]|nr:signal recognition particle-docking protein FtsY [Candidatus Thermoplasmatota archaeon]
MLERFRKRMSSAMDDGGIVDRSRLRDKLLEVLLESDVEYGVAELLVDETWEILDPARKITPEEYESALRKAIRPLIRLGGEPIDILKTDRKPCVILFVGINGTGKTTTIAKIAKFLHDNGKRSVIAASDTFRAGAIEQIVKHGDALGINVVRQTGGSDPSAVAFDAISHAKARNLDYVLIDTAGRMQTNRNLMEEMKKIRRVSSPDYIFLVLDSITGQDAIEQAQTFMAEIRFDGVIMTKLDTDARGGSVISVSAILKIPILFVGTGQGYGDLMKFDPDWYLEKILPGRSNR